MCDCWHFSAINDVGKWYISLDENTILIKGGALSKTLEPDWTGPNFKDTHNVGP